mmetsp:Transcript_2523/g.7548  ORF Transcript_2523/g.7548 Transcript_2523/m.7548 type:complete len:322 (-) Transcript_2523:104-1069(-)
MELGLQQLVVVERGPPGGSFRHVRLLSAGKKLLDVLACDVDLKVDLVTCFLGRNCDIFLSEWNHREREVVIPDITYCQTGSVHGNVTLGYDVFHEAAIAADGEPERILLRFHFPDDSSCIHVALHDVSAHPAVGGQRPFQVDCRTLFEIAKVCSSQRLWGESKGKAAAVYICHSKARSIHADAVSQRNPIQRLLCPDVQIHSAFRCILQLPDLSDLLHNSSKHHLHPQSVWQSRPPTIYLQLRIPLAPDTTTRDDKCQHRSHRQAAAFPLNTTLSSLRHRPALTRAFAATVPPASSAQASPALCMLFPFRHRRLLGLLVTS